MLDMADARSTSADEGFPAGRRRPGPDRSPVALRHRQPPQLVERCQEAAAMLGGNAAAFYGFDVEKLAPLAARIGPKKSALAA